MQNTKNGLNPSFMREMFCEHGSQYNLRNSTSFLLLELNLKHMAQKPFALEARKSGLPFHDLSNILHLLQSLKTKLNLGLEKVATADYANLFIPNLGFI